MCKMRAWPLAFSSTGPQSSVWWKTSVIRSSLGREAKSLKSIWFHISEINPRFNICPLPSGQALAVYSEGSHSTSLGLHRMWTLLLEVRDDCGRNAAVAER